MVPWPTSRDWLYCLRAAAAVLLSSVSTECDLVSRVHWNPGDQACQHNTKCRRRIDSEIRDIFFYLMPREIIKYIFSLLLLRDRSIVPGGLLGQVPDRDAQHRLSTRNATRVKKGGRNYTFCLILMRNQGRNTTFSPFVLKYRGRNYTNFLETWKRGVEMAEHM